MLVFSGGTEDNSRGAEVMRAEQQAAQVANRAREEKQLSSS